MVEIYGYSVATIPAVCIGAYAIIEILKYLFFSKKEELKRFIPIMAALIGCAITIIAFFACPEIVPASSWYGAALMGIASGLSSVGINQIKKQIEQNDGEGNGS